MKMIMSKENMDYAKSVVLNCLSCDRQYAIHQRDIKAHTGYDMRTIRFIIQALRDDGEPICSTTYEGYWLACNSLELNETINQLKLQVATLQATIDSLTETCHKFELAESGK